MSATIGGILFFCILLAGLSGLFLGTVQPLWAIIDVAISRTRGGFNKAIWIIVMIIFWGVMSAIYGVFSTGSSTLRRLTVVSLLLLIGVAIFVAIASYMNADFSNQLQRQWNDSSKVLTV